MEIILVAQNICTTNYTLQITVYQIIEYNLYIWYEIIQREQLQIWSY
jgi:hypothetical protein